jgi:hypothetical protein
MARCTMTATAYERVLDQLRNQGKRVRESGKEARAQCPSHDSRRATSKPLAIYSKPDKAKVVCFVGCSDVLDVLPALGMTVADLYDDRRGGSRTAHKPDPEIQARIEARRSMTPSQRALDDLLQLPDLGERLCLGIARIRPELYLWEREQLASHTQDASLASDSKRGGAIR